MRDWANRPVSCAYRLNSRTAASIDQRAPQRAGELAALVVGQEAAEDQLLALGNESQVRAPVRPFAQIHARPVGVAVELLAPPGWVHTRPRQLGGGKLDGLVEACRAIVEL